ncbi:MAG: type II secretion system protein GspE [Candidatus Omnitrophica bacterium]|nr:type II secretion system protein GspE [Candidatus Omnitrophota bacterium]
MAPEKSSTDLRGLLVAEGAVSEADMHDAVREQGETRESFLDILIRKGKCDEKLLVQCLCSHFGFSSVNPSIFVIEQSVLKLVPRNLAEKYTVLPITLFEKTLTVAFANPMNFRAIDELQAVTKMRVRPAVSQVSILKRYIQKYYSPEAAAAAESVQSSPAMDYEKEMGRIVEEIAQDQEGAEAQTSQLLKVAYESPVIKLVNRLLIEGIKRKASDIFIEPWENHVRVRARVDGLLEEVVCPPKSLATAIVSRIKVMSDLDIAEHRVPQDGRFKVKADRRQVDMRVSILPTTFGEKVCLRILDTSSQGHDISKLGFNEREQQIIRDTARRPHGMLLVTGPTGSGKTTTLYSVLKYLSAPEVNITTVEDPVEYQLPGINQVNVRDAVGLTFPAALRSILRQDPDIILIGEIRDNDTLDIAVKAALTGHLVLSTLHTNDAASSITRMVNMGLEPFLIASTVNMISAQRLMRRLCAKCRVPYDLPDEALQRLGGAYSEHVFYQPKGCPACRGSGYSGRTVITEILEMTKPVSDLIMKGESAEAIKFKARELGMTTLRQCALSKAAAGDTSLDEVFRVTADDASEKDEAS